MQRELDINFVRAQFPAFAHPRTGQWAFFENAGGAYAPAAVIDRLHEFFVATKVQPYAASEPSRLAGEAMDAGYQMIADLLNADPNAITLGPSTTINLYVLAQALRPALSVGDEIVVTNQDHEANIGVWRRLSEFGVRIREWRINPETGELDLEALKAELTERTRLVCVTLCSNVVGSVNPIADIARLTHEAGALLVGDAVSYAPHAIMDASRLGVDFLAYSTYKTFATHLGVLWCADEAMANLEPQGHYFNADEPHYRMNPAGPLHAEIGALPGLGDYIDALYQHHFEIPENNLHTRAARVFELVAAHESNQANRILGFLSSHPGVRLIGRARSDSGGRAPTISFTVRDRKATTIAERLAEQKIAVGGGHFYAVRCLQGLGIEPHSGVVRISLVHYNSSDDVDRLLSALDSVLD